MKSFVKVPNKTFTFFERTPKLLGLFPPKMLVKRVKWFGNDQPLVTLKNEGTWWE